MKIKCAYCRTPTPYTALIWIGNAARPHKPATWALCKKCAAHADECADGG